ncbi:cysteine desulfurase family protein [Anaerotaenia torta]|uniref:aminotransferase class V-fold PLP-dependent enzyme n=1 Tax=Anaerotaenia torta TaxID=433293 RepID=UPI003D22353F
MIYLDNAATSYHKPKAVAEAVYRSLMGAGNSGRGAHEASLEAGRIVFKTRKALASMFHAGGLPEGDPSRVVFTSNATESLNIAIQGILGPGDHCITTAMEHNSVLRPLYLMEKRGAEITVLPLDEKGRLEPGQMEAAVRKNTKAVILTHASNVTGNGNDIQGIRELCARHHLQLILDASQTAGLLPIDMQLLGISALCCSGHKGLMGPQGTGVLVLGEDCNPAPLKVGGTGRDSFSRGMPQQLPEALEAGTGNLHGITGLLAACEYIEEYGITNIYNKARELAEHFVDGVKRLPGVRLYGDYEAALRVPVVSLNIGETASGEIADELFQRFQIATRAGAHCAPLLHEAMGTREQGMVRFSFSHWNTLEEVQEAIAAVRILEEEYR